MNPGTWIRAAGLTLMAAACSQNFSDESPQKALAEKGMKPQPAGEQSASRPAAGEGRHDLGGLTAVLPEGWEQVPPSSSMRVAEYRLAGQGAEDASLAVFYFGPNQGGDVDANIERWYGQFTQPDGSPTRERSRRWDRQVAGMNISMVDIQGTYSGGMGPMGQAGGAQENYRMLGAIAEAPSGLFFFKLTGRQQTVDHWQQSFERYIGELQPRL